MSSGVVAAPGIGLVLLAPLAGAAIVAGAVVVLAARAAAAGAEAAAGGLIRLGECLDGQEAEYFEGQRAADLWQLAVAGAVERNARITAIRAFARAVRRSSSGSPDVPIPPPLDVTGKTLPQIYAWCADTDKALDLARAQLGKAAAEAATRRLAASLPAANVKLKSAAEMLAAQRAALASAAADADADAAVTAARRADLTARMTERLGAVAAALAGQLDAVLAELDPEARPEDREQALAAAARATAADPPQAGRTHAAQLERIVKRANKRASDARTAARYLQGAQADVIGTELDQQDHAVLRQLDAVVSGERELDEALNAGALEVLGKTEAAGARLYLREQVKEIMEAQGYEVESDFATLRPRVDTLTLSMAHWDEHHLRLVIDNGQIRYLTLRDHEVKGDAATRLDRERCDQVTAAVGQLTATLRSRGVDDLDMRANDDQPVIYLGQPPTAVSSQAEQARLSLAEPGEQER